LENVLPLSTQKFKKFDLFAQKSNLKTTANEKKLRLFICLLALDCLLAFACVLLENKNSKICLTTKILPTMWKKKMYKHALQRSKKINKVFLLEDTIAASL
jgi:hypothetical protein